MVVRAFDHDLDEENRPCWLEVDAVVGWDDGRGWYGDYERRTIEWIPKPYAASQLRHGD
jgi:hypothetical protein